MFSLVWDSAFPVFTMLTGYQNLWRGRLRSTTRLILTRLMTDIQVLYCSYWDVLLPGDFSLYITWFWMLRSGIIIFLNFLHVIVFCSFWFSGRANPDCMLGHLLKILFKNDDFMNAVRDSTSMAIYCDYRPGALKPFCSHGPHLKYLALIV